MVNVKLQLLCEAHQRVLIEAHDRCVSCGPAGKVKIVKSFTSKFGYTVRAAGGSSNGYRIVVKCEKCGKVLDR